MSFYFMLVVLCAMLFLQVALGNDQQHGHSLIEEEELHIPLDQIPIALVKEAEESSNSAALRSSLQGPPPTRPIPIKSRPPVGPPTPFSVPPLFPTKD